MSTKWDLTLIKQEEALLYSLLDAEEKRGNADFIDPDAPNWYVLVKNNDPREKHLIRLIHYGLVEELPGYHGVVRVSVKGLEWLSWNRK